MTAEDGEKRKKPAKLEDMVRDNFKQKVFAVPAKIEPSIEGIKGRGGKKIAPLFESIKVVEEVYKADKR